MADLAQLGWPPFLFALVVWMIVKVRRQVRSRSARLLLYPLLAVLAIASVGGGSQTVRVSLEARAYPPPGHQLIDVGGHRLHLYCTGSGSPTVVLEPGHGASTSDFGWITPAVARWNRWDDMRDPRRLSEGSRTRRASARRAPLPLTSGSAGRWGRSGREWPCRRELPTGRSRPGRRKPCCLGLGAVERVTRVELA